MKTRLVGNNPVHGHLYIVALTRAGHDKLVADTEKRSFDEVPFWFEMGREPHSLEWYAIITTDPKWMTDTYEEWIR
jgi:hypothetical protein